jgi:hypothetical protein
LPRSANHWGKQQAQLDPQQRETHAYAVLEAIAAAELDACLVQFATQKLELKPEEAAQILKACSERRGSLVLCPA